MTRLVLVGRNSFLARRFLALSPRGRDCLALTHEEALRPGALGAARTIVNFAFHPAQRREPYVAARDIDLQLARAIAGGDQRYIMLSSRMVYSPQVARGATETCPAGPGNTYGANKLRSELALGEPLGERLTVLRIANVFGPEYEAGRRTFLGIALSSLKEHGVITLDVAPEVERDFLPDNRFVEILDRVIDDPAAGVLNVGSGVPVALGDLAGWLIEGYGSGRLEVVDRRRVDAFVLDVTRLRERYGIVTTRDEVARHCRAIGEDLRRY